MTHAISQEAIRGCAEQLGVASQNAEKCLAHLDEPVYVSDDERQTEMRDLLRRVIDALDSTRHALVHELDPDHMDPTGGCPGCWSKAAEVVEV